MVGDRGGVAFGEVFAGDVARLGFPGFADRGDGHRLLGGEFHRCDDGEDHVARILRSVETQRQRVVAVGERRRGIGIGGIDRHAPRDGLRKCQRDLRDLFAQIVFRNAYFQHVNFVAELELHRLAGVVLLQSRGLDRIGHHHVPVAVEAAVLHVRDQVGGLRAVAFGRNGRHGIIGVGVRGHLRDVSPELGRVVVGVVVVEFESLFAEEGLGSGVDGPECDLVVGSPFDRHSVFAELGAGPVFGFDVDLRTGAYRYADCFGRGPGVRIRRIGACPEDQRQREPNNPEINSHRIDSFICNVYKNRYRFPFAEINSTNAGFFITNSLLFILTDAPFRRCGAQKTSLIAGLTVFEIPFCKSERYFY